MEVTRDVINDLLPGYLNGDVSADTRVLVEAFLQQDAELAALVHQRQAGFQHDPFLQGANMNLPPDLEMRALTRTKAMLRRRSWLLAFAVAFSLLPFAFRFDDGHITWMMLRDFPRMAAVYGVAAAAFWMAFAVTNRRLHSTVGL